MVGELAVGLFLLQALLSILKIEMWRGAHLPFN